MRQSTSSTTLRCRTYGIPLLPRRVTPDGRDLDTDRGQILRTLHRHEARVRAGAGTPQERAESRRKAGLLRQSVRDGDRAGRPPATRGATRRTIRSRGR